MTAMCECGCGQPAPIVKKTATASGYVAGLPCRFIQGHHRPELPVEALVNPYRRRYASGRGCGVALEHVLIAEAALGKRLSPRAHVHHVDENPRNNAPSNLVICEDAAYHKLLHCRMKVLRAGGDPNTEKWCQDCQQLKSFDQFNVMRSNKSTGRQSVCRQCSRARDAVKRARR